MLVLCCSILNFLLCSTSSYSRVAFPPFSSITFYSNVPTSLRTIADVMNDQM